MADSQPNLELDQEDTLDELFENIISKAQCAYRFMIIKLDCSFSYFRSVRHTHAYHTAKYFYVSLTVVYTDDSDLEEEMEHTASGETPSTNTSHVTNIQTSEDLSVTDTGEPHVLFISQHTLIGH